MWGRGSESNFCKTCSPRVRRVLAGRRTLVSLCWMGVGQACLGGLRTAWAFSVRKGKLSLLTINAAHYLLNLRFLSLHVRAGGCGCVHPCRCVESYFIVEQAFNPRSQAGDLL